MYVWLEECIKSQYYLPYHFKKLQYDWWLIWILHCVTLMMEPCLFNVSNIHQRLFFQKWKIPVPITWSATDHWTELEASKIAELESGSLGQSWSGVLRSAIINIRDHYGGQIRGYYDRETGQKRHTDFLFWDLSLFLFNFYLNPEG